MAPIPQKELRNNVGEVLRRAEAGEELTITVAGRPWRALAPPSDSGGSPGPGSLRPGPTPAPRALAEDLERFSTEFGELSLGRRASSSTPRC